MLQIDRSPFRLSATVSDELKPSPTLFMNERVADLWAAGETVYHLGFGESRFPVHPAIREALRANVHQKSYLAGQGLRALREQVAGFYQRRMHLDVSPDQIIVGPGSKSIIYAAQMALDADLILPTPCWVSYAPQAHLLKKVVRNVPASPGDHYTLHLDALDRVVQESESRNKILLITSPNNPTGQMYDPAFLQELADYCRRERIVVLSDEIYAFVPHQHKPHISIAAYYPEGTVILGGLSKHLSLGGWRLGVGIVPAHDEGRKLMLALRVIASEIWSTPTGPIQYAAITAYSGDPDIEGYIDECAQIHAIRTQFFWQGLQALEIPCAQPDGGFYMYPNFDKWRDPLAARGVRTSTDLAEYLLDRYQLATLPGTAFSTPAEDLSLRLATSYLDMETDERAEELLAAFRRNPAPERFMAEMHPMTQEALRRFGIFLRELTG